MAAGLGFKTFTTGEVLTAGDVNGYLMQGINVFTNATARDAAITAPAEGQFAFTKDNNSLWYYDGAAWVASGATGDIEGVTAGVGISGGGTSGTVTITNSMATEITASGDIIVGTGSGTFDNLPIGTTNQVLTADTTVSPYKVKWATPATVTSGLTLIKQASFSAVADTGTTFDGVFSSSYFDYLIAIDFVFCSVNDTELHFQGRVAGPTTISASYYANTTRLNFAGTETTFPSSNTAQFILGKMGDIKAGSFNGQAHISQVGNASEQLRLSGHGSDGASPGYDIFGGKIQDSRTYTGFIMKASSGNITGRVSIYGMAK
jgi:hypothetical protein